jgi:hypothetical protein
MFTSVIRDFLLQQETSAITTFHLIRVITQLNKRLSDADLSLTDSTVAVIISLCMASSITNNYKAMAAHSVGLRKIVNLRGGLDSFRRNPTLLIGMARLVHSLSF